MYSLLIILQCLSFAVAKTVVLDWHVSWVVAMPDGFVRQVIGINGAWPCPEVRVDVGDRLIVTVHNDLGDQSTSIHWHGLRQDNSTEMDGGAGISQCPIAPGSSFKYDFTVTQTGAYWYHSHNMGQYPDGLWGPLIVRDPNPPFQYDDELIVTVSEWYHRTMPQLISDYQSPAGQAPDGSPNPPSGGALLNSGKNVKIKVKPNKTYLLHVICPGAYIPHAFYFDDHPLTTVAIDGVYVKQQYLSGKGQLSRIAPGQRLSFLLKTKDNTSTNYGITDLMAMDVMFINKGLRPPQGYNGNVTAYLVYDDTKPLPPTPILYDVSPSKFFDDSAYIPLDAEPILEPVNHRITLQATAKTISEISRFTLNDVTYLEQHVPTLYSATTLNSSYSSSETVYGQVNPFIIKYNDVVEIVINNVNGNLHPWHVHGHHFQVIERSPPNTGLFPGTYNTQSPYRPTPSRRDTVMIQQNAWAVVRFRANNPGVWSMHCHVEFHVVSGFVGTLIEAPERLRSKKIPDDHIQACKEFPMKYEGNAVGNKVNPYDLTGSVSTVPSSNMGANYVKGSSKKRNIAARRMAKQD